MHLRADMRESVIQTAVESNDPDLAKEALRQIVASLRLSSGVNERSYLLFSGASCSAILEDFAGARSWLKMALDEGRDRPETQVTFDHSSGLLDQREGKYAEALERFTTMLSRHRQQLKSPELCFMYEDIQQRRAFLSVTLSKFQGAVPLLEEILSFDLGKEERSAALTGLGLSHVKLKDYERGREYFLQAIALGLTREWEGTAHFFLGTAYYYTGMVPEAKREFLLSEQLAGVHNLPIVDIYGWLAVICKRLGEASESERYSKLARRN